MMRFCCSGLATELLDADATARLPALCAWPQISWQMMTKWESHEDSAESLLLWLPKKLKSANSRLISGVMTITPLFSLWCRISWWSKPYRSPANQEHMVALTSPNSWNPGGGAWCIIYSLSVKKGFTHFICIHMPSTRRPNSNVCPRNPSQRQRSELLKAASANATKFRWPKCLCPCRGSCYTIRQKNASCKNHSNIFKYRKSENHHNMQSWLKMMEEEFTLPWSWACSYAAHCCRWMQVGPIRFGSYRNLSKIGSNNKLLEIWRVYLNSAGAVWTSWGTSNSTAGSLTLDYNL